MPALVLAGEAALLVSPPGGNLSNDMIDTGIVRPKGCVDRDGAVGVHAIEQGHRKEAAASARVRVRVRGLQAIHADLEPAPRAGKRRSIVRGTQRRRVDREAPWSGQGSHDNQR